MKRQGHYCKVCGEYKANEKFSGKGHASHICMECAKLPLEMQAERMTLNRLHTLPWRLSKEQRRWLNNRLKDKRPDVRELAREQYDMRFGHRESECGDWVEDLTEEELEDFGLEPGTALTDDWLRF